MKKLLLIVILVIVMSLTFTAPAFADDGKGNMPGKAADLGLWLGLWNGFGRMGWGLTMSGGKATAASARACQVIYYYLINGQSPESPWWSSAP